jgi:hypothetical protein
MPPPTLHYAPVPLTPIRFRPLALGTALLAVTGILPDVLNLLASFFLTSDVNLRLKFVAAIQLLNVLAVPAAVPFLAAAFPRNPDHPRPRWKFFTCLLFALLYALAQIVYQIDFIATFDIRAVDWSPSLPAQILAVVAATLVLFLLLAAVLYLLILAQRLGRRSLGILAALVPALTILLFLASFASNLLHAVHLWPSFLDYFSIIRPLSIARDLAHLALALLWLALALFATILALKPPRQPASTPL